MQPHTSNLTYSKYGGTRRAGGRHLQCMFRRNRKQGASSAGASVEFRHCGATSTGKFAVRGRPQGQFLHQGHDMVRPRKLSE